MTVDRPSVADVERVVTLVWNEFLEQPVTRPTDNIFDKGAHSLLITRCRGRLQELLGARLGTAPFFEHPTIDRFAAAITAGPDGPRMLRRARTVVRVLDQPAAEGG
jgi:hypothetical protein